MPLRKLTARTRSTSANWQLAALLAFNAGAVDVTGYLSLRQYTSHMSGLVALMAEEFSLRGIRILLEPAAILASFLTGAAICALLVNWARRRDYESLYAVPVLLEAAMLASLAVPGATTRFFLTLCVLSFSMGLQNAIITKLSDSVIRTTHVTGMVTDIGIELGKALYWNRSHHQRPVHADRGRLMLLSMLVSLFFAGGTLGAFTYPHIGFLIMLPLAAMLASLTVLPIASDLHLSHAH
jgi:uncharacterized membrane protein YoaK (UPF0700 family)